MAEKPRDPAVSIWVKPPKRSRRGSAPSGLSRERIVRATVELLDADGVAAFSMRRLAAELEVTAMSLYWYVDTKDDLLELALDEAFAPLGATTLEDHGDWRRHLRTLAHQYRSCYQHHPWAPQLAGQFLPLGPNSLLFSNSAVGAMTHSGLPAEQFGAALGLLFEFVYGHAVIESLWLARVRASGLSEDEFYRELYGVIEQATPGFVENADLMANQPRAGQAAVRDLRFAQSLDLALAGIEATIAAAAAG
ncbi:TetR/AcrR family transcriptional regulator [Kitasatospora sp. GAS204B]|uniref:TetR/AcrR family transcriptional regulator n=1 Tax=unclassified Kitasatospora TaxID=2633591 RepID=UPI002476BDF4|nr:TetR/AcrR family transcriptional regulator [Kitasatospora sp. GAS204B]MDH6118584.1 AcrR family transcriptional regulator [Kitasatospora sp. GAS204B]